MTDIDPSIVGQHTQTLKNNYFKAWFALIRLCLVILKPFYVTLEWKTGGTLV